MTTPGKKARPVAERVLSKVIVTPSECWEWQGQRDKAGYGRVSVGSRIDGTKRIASAHRTAYEAFVGPVPDGLELDHLCRNRGCVNPAHLEPVTRLENVRRARRAHCPRGHLLEGRNLYLNPAGNRRGCRECNRQACLRYRARKAAS